MQENLIVAQVAARIDKACAWASGREWGETREKRQYQGDTDAGATSVRNPNR